MLGNNIILTPEPRGRRTEGVAAVDLLPGTVVQVKTAVAPDAGNRLTFEPYNTVASGVPKIIAIVDANWLEGQTADTTILAGKRVFVYYPLPGDELNMLVDDVAGTGATSDFAIGDPLMVQDGTGLLIDGALGTLGYAQPFEVQETYNDMVGDTRLHVKFTGY